MRKRIENPVLTGFPVIYSCFVMVKSENSSNL